jgi:hypothetical protein
VRVGRQRADVEPHAERALIAEGDRRPAVAEPRRRALPETRVGGQQIPVRLDDLGEMRAADLFLALDDPADTDRKLAVALAQRSDRREPDRELALVVGDAAGVDLGRDPRPTRSAAGRAGR